MFFDRYSINSSALKFDNNKVIEEVGELPTHKIHCSVLAKEAIEDAINKYKKAKLRAIKREEKQKQAKLEKKNTQKANCKKLNSLLNKLDKK